MMTTTWRRAGPVLALAALLATACSGPADSAGHARPASLLAAGHVKAEVPAGFQPAAASFLSARTGFVLGGVGCRIQRACTARLVATADGGARWHFLKTPAVRFFNDAGASRGQASRVSSVVFAGRRDGWLYGPGLWSTRDGGARWHRADASCTRSARPIRAKAKA